jgi:hypothetical protein
VPNAACKRNLEANIKFTSGGGSRRGGLVGGEEREKVAEVSHTTQYNTDLSSIT